MEEREMREGRILEKAIELEQEKRKSIRAGLLDKLAEAILEDMEEDMIITVLIEKLLR